MQGHRQSEPHTILPSVLGKTRSVVLSQEHFVEKLAWVLLVHSVHPLAGDYHSQTTAYIQIQISNHVSN